MYLTTEGLVTRHSIVLHPIPELRGQIVPGQHGLYFSKYGLGQPLAATIPMILARALHPIFFNDMRLDMLQYYAVTLFSQFVTALTGALVFLMGMRLGYGLRLSIGLALAWGLCTPAWPYAETFFSEPLFTLGLVAGALGLLAYRQTEDRTRFLWLAFAASGLSYAILTRLAGATVIPLFAIYGLWAMFPHPEGYPLRAVCGRVRSGRIITRRPASITFSALLATIAAAGIPFAIGIGLALWHNQARFGDPFNGGYGTETFSTPARIGIPGLLISPGKGVIWYAPLTMLAIAGGWHFYRRHRATSLLFASITLVTVIQYGLWWHWEGGWTWGPRFVVPMLPFIILALGPVLQTSQRARWAAWPLAGAGLFVAVVGVLGDFNAALTKLYMRYERNNAGPAEPDIYFRWSYSPIIEHTRSALTFSHPGIIIHDLDGRFGFSPLFGPGLIVVLFALMAVSVALVVSAIPDT
jgi:hypothetical protein